MRKYDYSSILDNYVTLDGSLTTRDKTAIRKSFSGLVKLIYPHQELTEEEVLDQDPKKAILEEEVDQSIQTIPTGLITMAI